MEYVNSIDYTALMKSLGERLKEARENADLTQVEAARRIGVTSQSFNMWERDKSAPSRTNLHKIANVLGVTTDWLLDLPQLQEQIKNIRMRVVGRHVPMYSSGHIIAGADASAIDDYVFARFPCNDGAFGYELTDNRNAPESPKGTVWIVDVTAPQEPGKLALAVVGKDHPRIVCGRLRYESTPHGTITILMALDSNWPDERSDQTPLRVVGVATERIHQVP